MQGTFDATTQGRTTVCPACAGDSYCPSGVSQQACPVHTGSLPGTATALGCGCRAGFTCKYTKRITAVVVLNHTSVSGFNADTDGVRSSFLAAIAAAAGVPVSQITILGVSPHVGGGGRRLLAMATTTMGEDPSVVRKTLFSVAGKAAGAAAQEDHVVNVRFEVRDVQPTRNFRSHLTLPLA